MLFVIPGVELGLPTAFDRFILNGGSGIQGQRTDRQADGHDGYDGFHIWVSVRATGIYEVGCPRDSKRWKRR